MVQFLQSVYSAQLNVQFMFDDLQRKKVDVYMTLIHFHNALITVYTMHTSKMKHLFRILHLNEEAFCKRAMSNCRSMYSIFICSDRATLMA